MSVAGRARPGRRPVRAPGALATSTVVFRVAASPRIGFGHLVRAIHLAGALDVPARVSLRGTAAAADTARGLGVDILPVAREAVVRPGLALLVIDDPSRIAAAPWLRAARRAGVPVASFHDVGIAPLASDLAIDGSLGARRVEGLGVDAGACLLGPAYAVLSPALGRSRRPRARTAAPAATVLIGLGGGQQAAAGASIARHLRAFLDRLSGPSRVQVLLSLGLARSVDAGPRALPVGIDVVPPERFREALARATVAVVAGGTTLYEACALGTPVVAVPVVPAQATTVRRFVRAGLATGVRSTAGVGSEAWGRSAAAAVLGLLKDAGRREDQSRRGRRAIDGVGAARVARAIDALVGERAGRP